MRIAVFQEVTRLNNLTNDFAKTHQVDRVPFQLVPDIFELRRARDKTPAHKINFLIISLSDFDAGFLCEPL